MKTLTASSILFKPAALAALLTLAAVATAPLPAQQTPAALKAAYPTSATAVDEEESVAPAKPGSEGIKVHGHWVIDVKDKDGKLVEHRDFQNALTDANPLLLLLTGQIVPNSIAVVVQDSTSNFYNMYPATTATLKPFASYNCNSVAPVCNPNLVVAMVGSAADPQTPAFTGLKFTGQFAPTTSASLTAVSTVFYSCLIAPLSTAIGSLTVAPSACATAVGNTPTGSNFYAAQLTGTTLKTPLSVAAGQTVSVTVILSFS